MLSELQSIARVVTPYALDIYDRSAANALLPQLTATVPNPTKAKSLTIEWTTLFTQLHKWVGERIVQRSFATPITIVGEKYEITDAVRYVRVDTRGEWLFNVTGGTPRPGAPAFVLDDNTVSASVTNNAVQAGRFTRPYGPSTWFIDVERVPGAEPSLE